MRQRQVVGCGIIVLAIIVLFWLFGVILELTGNAPSSHSAAPPPSAQPERPARVLSSTAPTATLTSPTPVPFEPADAVGTFVSGFDVAAQRESAGWLALGQADLTPNNGPVTIPALQRAMEDFRKAGDASAYAGGSPFDDVGATMTLTLSDEETEVQQMLFDYPGPKVQDEYQQIAADHQKVLRLIDEMRQHGYR